jgi:hypothetical protein
MSIESGLELKKPWINTGNGSFQPENKAFLQLDTVL